MVSMSRWAQRESEQKRALEESQEQVRREQELRRTLEESVDRKRVRKRASTAAGASYYMSQVMENHFCVAGT
jgi:hypothetical protein